MDSVSRANGGIFEAERRLQQSLHIAGVKAQVVGLQDAHTEADRPQWSPLIPLVHDVRGPLAFGYAPGFLNTLLQADADLAYCAGLWKYPSLAALRWMQKSGKPLIVAPHGMLDPWALENSRFKKQVARWLFQNAQLRHAACLRALCAAEAQSIRACGLKNPIAVIPNGIDLPQLPAPGSRLPAPPWAGSIVPGRKVLLFLSRIHAKKGLVNLLRAWAAVQKSVVSGLSSGGHGADWTLAIAGWDQGGHEAELKTLATELGLAWADVRDQKSVVSGQWSVVFLGPQFRENKAACYANCDAFILPSFSEGLPMVVLEAWAHGKPVLMTPECNLPEGFTHDAAIRIETNPESITQGLSELFRAANTSPLRLDRGEGQGEVSISSAGLHAPRSTLHALGANGRALVAEKFAWPKIANDMKSVYEWVLRGGTKPQCVVTD